MDPLLAFVVGLAVGLHLMAGVWIVFDMRRPVWEEKRRRIEQRWRELADDKHVTAPDAEDAAG